jgi:hypothetical protein
MAARVVAAALPTDIDAIAAVLAPDVEFTDHRRLGFGTARGAERYLRGLRSLLDVTRGRIANVDEIFAASPDAPSCSERPVNGKRRWRLLRDALHDAWAFGPDGRIARVEMFGPIAPTKHCTLTADGGATAPRFANAASRRRPFGELWAGARPEMSRHSLPISNVDRRAVGRASSTATPSSRATALLGWRIESKNDLLATRGERLALARVLDRGHPEVGRDGPGPFEIEFLQILEIDAAGRIERSIVFDPSDLDAAYAEIDRRYADGEGAPHAALLAHWAAFRAATNARDWDTARSLLPDAFHMQSHRRLANSGMRLGRDRSSAP